MQFMGSNPTGSKFFMGYSNSVSNLSEFENSYVNWFDVILKKNIVVQFMLPVMLCRLLTTWFITNVLENVAMSFLENKQIEMFLKEMWEVCQSNYTIMIFCKN